MVADAKNKKWSLWRCNRFQYESGKPQFFFIFRGKFTEAQRIEIFLKERICLDQQRGFVNEM